MTGERHSFQGFVPERCAGQRLDRVAAELLADFSRSRLAAWIRSGALTVDGRQARPAYRVLGGEPLALDVAGEAHGGPVLDGWGIGIGQDTSSGSPTSFPGHRPIREKSRLESQAPRLVHSRPFSTTVPVGSGGLGKTLLF